MVQKLIVSVCLLDLSCLSTFCRGKTTLLKYLAARQLPIPAGVDVMLVEQEVLASETSVVNQVHTTGSAITLLHSWHSDDPLNRIRNFLTCL